MRTRDAPRPPHHSPGASELCAPILGSQLGFSMELVLELLRRCPRPQWDAETPSLVCASQIHPLHRAPWRGRVALRFFNTHLQPWFIEGKDKIKHLKSQPRILCLWQRVHLPLINPPFLAGSHPGWPLPA